MIDQSKNCQSPQGYTHCQNVWHGWPVYEVKCLCSRGQEWGREDCHSHQLFSIWFLWHEVIVIQRSWYLHWIQNGKALKLGWLFFSCFMKWNWRLLNLKSWHFEASEDIMTKFTSPGLHIIRIKYCNAGWSGNPPSFISTLWNIGILLHKQATRAKYFDGECFQRIFWGESGKQKFTDDFWHQLSIVYCAWPFDALQSPYCWPRFTKMHKFGFSLILMTDDSMQGLRTPNESFFKYP